MIKEFILPDIGEGVVECELVEWLVKEGDSVVEDQAIADVMTDKALVQIPAPDAGVIKKLHYAKGEIAKVHAPLYSIALDEPSASASDLSHNPVEPEPQLSVAETAPNTRATAVNAKHSVEPVWQREEFLLPDIGEGIVECELIEWLVEEGDIVVEDQPVADVMTDKALVQIPAIKPGRIAQLHYRKGQLAKVHEPLFAIEFEVDVEAEVETEVEIKPAETKLAQALPEATAIESASGLDNVTALDQVAQGKALASPAVRRMARSLGIDIAKVAGSGKNGRVYKEDISRHQNALQQQSSAVKSSAVHSLASAAGAEGMSGVVAPATPPLSDADGTRVEPIRGVRAVMAKMMQESVATIPHFTYADEFDLTELVALRERMKQQHSSDSLKLTLMPFFMKAMSLALKAHPDLNSQVNADCSEQTFFERHNIGMAVDSAMGLLVPNVKDVQAKSILAIAAEITRLTTAARSGRVAPEDLKQGTISISNIGAIGGTIATPIINKPEVAIVALGRLQRLPRFNAAGEVEARDIMQVSWSGDHRVIDGATMARFCNLWKHYLEQPQEMLLAMQ